MDRLVILRLGLVMALLSIIVALIPFSISAQTGADHRPLGASGLPLPRFVSINKSAANVRRGPSEEYPLLYQYQRHGLPLEIIGEYGQWRQIRDHEGSEGWMHARLLRGGRTVMLRQAATAHMLRNRAKADGGIVALVQPGAIARLDACDGDWCEIEVKGHTGWLNRDALWGVYDFEFND
jgi:SH3-like domain-containing protein